MKNLEKQLYLTFFKDGLTDMFWGLLLIGFGCNAIFSMMEIERPLSLILCSLPVIVLYLLAKWYISKPRMGTVKFGPARRKKRLKALLIAIIAQVLTLIVLWVLITKAVPQDTFSKFVNPATEFIFLVSITSLIAYISDYNRLYWIGLAVAIGWPLAEALDPYMGTIWAGIVAFGIPGTIFFIYGLILFIKFLKEHPAKNIQADYHGEK